MFFSVLLLAHGRWENAFHTHTVHRIRLLVDNRLPGEPSVVQLYGASDSERRARTAAGALRDAAQRLNEEEEAMAAEIPSISQKEKNRKVADGLAAMDNFSMGGAGPDDAHPQNRSSSEM